jgi:hypothetical protein
VVPLGRESCAVWMGAECGSSEIGCDSGASRVRIGCDSGESQVQISRALGLGRKGDLARLEAGQGRAEGPRSESESEREPRATVRLGLGAPYPALALG